MIELARQFDFVFVIAFVHRVSKGIQPIDRVVAAKENPFFPDFGENALGDPHIDPGRVTIDIGMALEDGEGGMIVAHELHMGGDETEIGVIAGFQAKKINVAVFVLGGVDEHRQLFLSHEIKIRLEFLAGDAQMAFVRVKFEAEDQRTVLLDAFHQGGSNGFVMGVDPNENPESIGIAGGEFEALPETLELTDVVGRELHDGRVFRAVGIADETIGDLVFVLGSQNEIFGIFDARPMSDVNMGIDNHRSSF